MITIINRRYGPGLTAHRRQRGSHSYVRVKRSSASHNPQPPPVGCTTISCPIATGPTPAGAGVWDQAPISLSSGVTASPRIRGTRIQLTWPGRPQGKVAGPIAESTIASLAAIWTLNQDGPICPQCEGSG